MTALLSRLARWFRRAPVLDAEVLAPPIKIVIRDEHYYAVKRRWHDDEVAR